MAGTTFAELDDPAWRARVAEEARAAGDVGEWVADGYGMWTWRDDKGSYSSEPPSRLRKLYPGMSPLFDLCDASFGKRPRTTVGAQLATRRRGLIPGASLCGFFGMFDGDAGDANTPQPYPCVTPSRVGDVLLPFRCPHCSAVRAELVTPVLRRSYFDAKRGFYWCPACRKRLLIERAGTPLLAALPAGAACAPALVQNPPAVVTAGSGGDADDDAEEAGLFLLGVG